jgi:transcription elongation factor Elf1
MIPFIDHGIPCPRCGSKDFEPVKIDPKNMVKEYKKCKQCGWAQQTDLLDGGVAVGRKHTDIEP